MYRIRYVDYPGRAIGEPKRVEHVPMSQGNKTDLRRALNFARTAIDQGRYSDAVAFIDWARAGCIAKSR